MKTNKDAYDPNTSVYLLLLVFIACALYVCTQMTCNCSTDMCRLMLVIEFPE